MDREVMFADLKSLIADYQQGDHTMMEEVEILCNQFPKLDPNGSGNHAADIKTLEQIMALLPLTEENQPIKDEIEQTIKTLMVKDVLFQ